MKDWQNEPELPDVSAWEWLCGAAELLGWPGLVGFFMATMVFLALIW